LKKAHVFKLPVGTSIPLEEEEHLEGVTGEEL
jgi:hypothetical protein